MHPFPPASRIALRRTRVATGVGLAVFFGLVLATGTLPIETLVQGTLAVVVLAVVLIAGHEAGHYWAACAFGVRTHVFCVGLGPAVWHFTSRTGYPRWQVGAIPLGGFVQLETRPDAPGSLVDRSRGQQAIVILAGPAASLALGIFVCALSVALGRPDVPLTVTAVDPGGWAQQAGIEVGDRLQGLSPGNRLRAGHADGPSLRVLRNAQEHRIAPPPGPDFSPETLGMTLRHYDGPIRIGPVVPDSAAARAGFETGDRIEQIDGVPVSRWTDLIQAIGRAQTLTLSGTGADGTRFDRVATPSGTPAILGVGPAPADVLAWEARWPKVHPDWLTSLVVGTHTVWAVCRTSAEAFARLVIGRGDARALAGPIGIGRMTVYSARGGLRRYLELMGIISAAVGFVNLLPVPPLDGGRLAMLAAEGLRGRRLAQRTEQWANLFGLAMIGWLLIIATWNDLGR